MMRRNSKLLGWIAAALVGSWGAQAAEVYYPGVAKVSLYWDIPGTAVSALTGSPKYPDVPDETRFFTEADAGSALGDNYGGRMEFLWTAPTTGSFQFAIAADDNAQLWVSTDESPANLQLVATEPEWNGVRAFGSAERRPGCGGVGGYADCENVSDPISITAGQRYLIVGLWKEGTGGDNFAVAVAPTDTGFFDGDLPIPGDEIGVITSDTATVLGAPRASASHVYVGRTIQLSAPVYQPPTDPAAVQWFKDGVAIAGATSSTLSYTAAAADVDQTMRFSIRVGTTDSPEVTVRGLADLPDVLSPGFMTVEFFTGIGGTSIAELEAAEKFINNEPDEIRYVSSFSSPDGYGDNYGSRVSGFITPTESGNYYFFLRSDDLSQLHLSTDDDPANAVLIAEVFTCCQPFQEPDLGASQTSEAISLVAGTRYAVYALLKEGGGGDWLQVAWRRDTDTTPAASLTPLSGSVISTMAEPAGVEITFTQQPQSATVEATKTITLSVGATAFPVDSVSYQWQRNDVDIPGATGSSYTLPIQTLADTGARYRVVARTLANVSANSAEAVITVVSDTTPPQVVSAGTVRKDGRIEIGVLFDEPVTSATASVAANYSLSAGTIDSVRFVEQSSAPVLVASGLTAGQTVTLTVRNVADTAGNAIPAAGVTTPVVVTGTLNWVGIGGDEANELKGSTAFSDDAVVYSESDFDLISGGTANWDAYDEATFVYEEITGDFDRVVRVEYQDPTSQWARAGLHVREALDEGTTRDETFENPMARNLSVRVNPAVQADGNAGNNNHETIDRNVTGGNYRGTPNGVPGGAPPYPNAWMRIARDGPLLQFWRSSDGVTWEGGGTLNWEDETLGTPPLANTLYVGVYYAPEFGNNEILTLDKLTRSAVAKFRDYGPFQEGPTELGPLTAARTATGLTISWPAGQSAQLQSAPSVTGPWTTVAGASSPHSVTTTEGSMYFRLSSP